MIRNVRETKNVDMAEQLRLLVIQASRTGLKTSDGSEILELADGRALKDFGAMHLMVDSLQKIHDRLSEDPQAKEQFERGVSGLLDVALAAEWPEGSEPRFKKIGSVALTKSVLTYLADRAEERSAKGALDVWLLEEAWPALRDAWTSRLLTGLVLIAEDLLGSEQVQAVLDAFVEYMVGSEKGRRHTMLTGFELAVRATRAGTWAPIARFGASVLDPGSRLEDQRREGAPAAALSRRAGARRDAASGRSKRGDRPRAARLRDAQW